MALKRKQSEDSVELSSARPAKIAKTEATSESAAPKTPDNTGAAMEMDITGENDSPANKIVVKDEPTNGKAPPKLVFMGQKQEAVLGTKDESLLRIPLQNETGEKWERVFSLDWNNPVHIAIINEWRGQVQSDATTSSPAVNPSTVLASSTTTVPSTAFSISPSTASKKKREVTPWLQDEEMWLELYYHLHIDAASRRRIAVPVSPDVREAFNAFFEGKVFQDRKGNDLPARIAREKNPFKAKLARHCATLKQRLDDVLGRHPGNGGVESYQPNIDEDMFEVYKKLKIAGTITEADIEGLTTGVIEEDENKDIEEHGDEDSGEDTKEGTDQDTSKYSSDSAPSTPTAIPSQLEKAAVRSSDEDSTNQSLTSSSATHPNTPSDQDELANSTETSTPKQATNDDTDADMDEELWTLAVGGSPATRSSTCPDSSSETHTETNSHNDGEDVDKGAEDDADAPEDALI